MIKFKTAEEMVTWMKSSAATRSSNIHKKNPNMFYCGGRKVKKSQIWRDIMGWDYSVESVDVDKHIVELKRLRDNTTFSEIADNLVNACSLSVDVKNGQKISV